MSNLLAEKIRELDDRLSSLEGLDVHKASFTAGSVLFADTNGSMASDPTQLFWDNANNRLGIGTNAPDLELDIESSSTAYTAVEITNTNGSTRRWAVAANSNSATFGPAKGFFIRDITGNATRLMIDTTGQTTLRGANAGVASETGILMLVDNANANRKLYMGWDTALNGGSGANFIQSVLSGTAYYPLILNPQQSNVGIGGTPTRQLSVVNASHQYLSFVNNTTEKAVIGVELTSPNRFIFYSTALAAFSGMIDLSTNYWRIGDGSVPGYRLELPNTASAAGQGRANAWVTYSSRERKTNIKQLAAKALRAKLKDFSLVSFDWNDQQATISEIGVIAEDLQLLAPELVTGDLRDPMSLGVKESKAGLIALALVLDLIADQEKAKR